MATQQRIAHTALQERLEYTFADPALLLRSLTHVSYERRGNQGHNEVLEFLGDAVLDLVISDLLIRAFPDKDEGELSRMRAALVNAAALAEKATQLSLGEMLRLGKGEERSGGRHKTSILAGSFEALLGALYQDGGYEPVRRLVQRHFAEDIQSKQLGLRDYKTRLQEISQMMFQSPPTYRLVSESGPDHDKCFVTEIAVGGRVLGTGEGKSKKRSEQEAAREAMERLLDTGPARAKQ